MEKSISLMVGIDNNDFRRGVTLGGRIAIFTPITERRLSSFQKIYSHAPGKSTTGETQ